jgi:hypothetical protein
MTFATGGKKAPRPHINNAPPEYFIGCVPVATALGHTHTHTHTHTHIHSQAEPPLLSPRRTFGTLDPTFPLGGAPRLRARLFRLTAHDQRVELSQPPTPIATIAPPALDVLVSSCTPQPPPQPWRIS